MKRTSDGDGSSHIPAFIQVGKQYGLSNLSEAVTGEVVTIVAIDESGWVKIAYRNGIQRWVNLDLVQAIIEF